MDNLVSVKVEEPETTDDLPSEVKNEETEVFEQFNNAEGENEKTLDPYAYLQRPGFSSENFKIEILNMPKFFSFTDFKKFLQKQTLTPAKIKFNKTFLFVTFRNEEERNNAMAKLKGIVYKGKELDVKLAKPMQDPLIKKRRADANGNSETENFKKAKLCESIKDQITQKVVPYFGIPYDKQLELKKDEMIKNLKKITREIQQAHNAAKSVIRENVAKHCGTICEFVEVIGSPSREKYRNKCEFTVGINPETNELTLGFRVSSYKEGSCAVGPVSHVPFIPDAMMEVIPVFEKHFRSSGRAAFNPEDHSGFWRQVTVRTNLQNHVLVMVAVNPLNVTPVEMESVKKELEVLGKENNIHSLYIHLVGQKKSGEEPPLEHILGATHLVERLCDLEFSISPLAFFQVNSLSAQVLYNKIAEIAEIDENTNVLDVYCGTGTIALSVAKKCKQVYGVELIKSAVEDAKRNAEKNGITNCVFIAGKAEDELSNLISQIDSTSGKDSKIVAILDPPRAGLHKKCCQLLRVTERIQRLVYVSCDVKLATKSFVDLCRSTSNNYAGTPFFPVKAFAVDLFPDLPQCEFVMVLDRYRQK